LAMSATSESSLWLPTGEQASRPQRDLDGRTVSARYKPAEPAFSSLEEEELDGRRISQTPQSTLPGTVLLELRLSRPSKSTADLPRPPAAWVSLETEPDTSED
jgi:hypothetical protein